VVAQIQVVAVVVDQFERQHVGASVPRCFSGRKPRVEISCCAPGACRFGSATACGRIFGDAPCASYSRDCRIAGYSGGLAGARGRFRHGRLQRDVLLAAWRASSFSGAEHGASFPRGRHGVPSWRVGAHDGVQHEVRATAHGLRPARAVSAGSCIRGEIA
jgi:hypothetical protein